jgi:DNA-binding response OmpR family regulator
VPRILIIEDEESILMGLEDDLGLEGYAVSGVRDGAKGLAAAMEGRYDLIILDIMLPNMDGFDVCKRLRHAEIMTPILMLTAKSQEVDKVLGLELGADDYVTKPFSPRELLARVKALLRRARPEPPAVERFTFGDVEVDFRKYEVTKGGTPVALTVREFELLRHLIENREKVVDRGAILEDVWGEGWDVFPRTIDTHIAHLRKKIEDDPASPRHILNVRGVGYRFEA